MAGFAFNNIRIAGMTGAVPKNVVPSRFFEFKFGTETVEKFINLTGVEQCHKTLRNQTASDLGYVAANNLFDKLSVKKDEIGALIFVSESPDYIWPSTACVLQHRLGLSEECLAYDINLGCSGFVYGFHVCSSLLQSMEQKYALLITGDANKFQNLLDREKPDDSNLMLFGDAVTATIIERTEYTSEAITELYTDGSRYKMLVRGGMSRSVDESKDATRWNDGIDRSIEDPYMDGMGVFVFSTREAPKAINKFLTKYNKNLEDFDCYFLHQANKMIVDRIARILKMPSDKVPMTIDRYGNTASATIPLTMIDKYGLADEDVNYTVLTCGFGVGLSWGVLSVDISPKNVFPIIETDEYFKDGELYPNWF